MWGGMNGVMKTLFFLLVFCLVLLFALLVVWVNEEQLKNFFMKAIISLSLSDSVD